MEKEILNILLSILSATLQAIAVAMMKKSSNKIPRKNRLYILLTGGLYVVSLPLYAKGLSELRLNIAQPVFTATMFIITAVLSILVFHEKFRRSLLLGIALILSGIVVIAI
jgi:multidrug transporter EmrE-like cation transporter